MAENVGYATLTVIPSMKGFSTALSSQVGPQMNGVAARAGTTAGGKFKAGFTQQLKGIGTPLLAAIGGAAVFQGFKAVIDQASQAEQAVGGVRAVFGEYADGVIRDSERAANALGLSETAYQQLITVSGALLKNKGLEDYAQQAENLVGIGADLAAQFGGSTQQAVEALNAAMRGESDPIERYAISLNETAVNAELAKSGADKLTGAALDQAKAQARLNIIMSQSADAQGAFAREADTLAGKQARLSAEWDNMQVALGEKLLPVTADFVGFLSDEGLPALESFGGAVQDVAGFVKGLPDGATQAALTFGGLWLAMSKLGGGPAIIGRISGAVETAQIKTLLWRDSLASAATRINALKGAAVLGGVALSMTDIADESNRAGQAIEGGLTGALLGAPFGPVGMAVGGLVGGLGSLAMGFFDSGEAAKQATRPITDYASTLDAVTGATTEATRAAVARRLEEDGLLEAMERSGLSTSRAVTALLKGGEAQVKFTQGIREQIRAIDEGAAAAEGYTFINERGIPVTVSAAEAEKQYGDAHADRRDALLNLLGFMDREGTALARQRDAVERTARANRDNADATQSATEKIAEQIRETNRLANAHNRLVETFITAKEGQIGLAQSIDDAAAEARQGADTLDINTQAGRDNYNALLDVAQGWNDLPQRMQGAKGAYRDMRQNFIDLAESMGASERKAERLAEKLLNLPTKKKVQVEFEVADDPTSRFLLGGRMRVPGMATGGKVGGFGLGDTQLRLLDPREWVINPKAVSYYGDDLLRALNKMQIPRMANGGPVTPSAPSRPVQTTGLGQTVNIGQVVTQNPRVFARQMQDESRKRRVGGI